MCNAHTLPVFFVAAWFTSTIDWRTKNYREGLSSILYPPGGITAQCEVREAFWMAKKLLSLSAHFPQYTMLFNSEQCIHSWGNANKRDDEAWDCFSCPPGITSSHNYGFFWWLGEFNQFDDDDEVAFHKPNFPHVWIIGGTHTSTSLYKNNTCLLTVLSNTINSVIENNWIFRHWLITNVKCMLVHVGTARQACWAGGQWCQYEWQGGGNTVSSIDHRDYWHRLNACLHK